MAEIIAPATNDEAAVVHVLYPDEARSTFKWEYYLGPHMALVEQQWKPHGLKNWVITAMEPDTGYCVEAILFWDSPAAWEKGAKEAGPTVLGDIPNFSSKSPDIWVTKSKALASGFSAFA